MQPNPAIDSSLALVSLAQVPQLSFASTATEFKKQPDSYPTLYRMAPTSDLQAETVVDVLLDFGFSDVCVLGQPLDLYSTGGAQDFVAAANSRGLTVLKDVKTSNDLPSPEDAAHAIAELDNARCRVVFVVAQAGAIKTMVESAKEAGVAGAGSNWVWFFGTSGMSVVANDPSMKGSFVLEPSPPSGSAFLGFKYRFGARPSSQGSCGGQDGTMTRKRERQT